jgi:eukaryotic-like serine/threonine-protein kinase
MVEPNTSTPGTARVPEFFSGTAVGRFLIGPPLGKGSMGEVYRAEDPKLKRSVALKRLPPALRNDSAYRRRLLEEAERASNLSDAHIAAIYDVLEEQGEIFLVMEYVEGETLRDRLKRPITLDEFFSIATQCAEALAAAHRRGIVHCDIKPENIMLNEEGQVKILDFGVAKHLPSSDLSTTLDRVGTVSGTPAYMAPEVLLGRSPDGRADVFSLGVVFYEILTHQQPFIASSFVATADRVRNERPTPIRVFNREVPKDLEAVINRSMAKEPGQRYANARELLDDLSRVRVVLTPSVLSRILPHRQNPRRKHIFAAVLFAAIFIGLLAALVQRVSLRRLVGLNPPPPIHLAVLPFVPTGNDPNAKAFSDGLTETLAAKLTQLTGSYPLQIVPTSEVRAEGMTTADQARKGFGVNLVLEGALQEYGSRVRVTYSLVDTKSMRQIKGDAITADASDVFGLQDSVVESVISTLGLQLRGEDRTAMVSHGTQEPVAHDFYLRALGYLQDYHKPENVMSAITLFQRALERDPKYAMAYAGLGEAYWAKYDDSRDKQWLDKGLQACQKSVTLAPDSENGHTCLGRVYMETGKYEGAMQEFNRALQIDKTSEGAYRGLASAYERLGRIAEAEQTYRMAIQTRPHYWAGYEWLGSFYSHQARYADAVREINTSITLAPDDPHGYRNLGGVYIYMGDYQQAIKALTKAIELSPSTDSYSNLGVAYFNLHQFDKAIAAYKHACIPGGRDYVSCGNLARAYYWAPNGRGQAEELCKQAIVMAQGAHDVNPRDGDPLVLMASYYAMLGKAPDAKQRLKQALDLSANPEYFAIAAMVHNLLGDKDDALAFVQKAVDGGYSKPELRAAPELDSLRSDARFQKLMQ